MARENAQETPEHWSRLMQAAQGGDSASYRQLLGEITPVLKSFLRARLFARDQIDDVTQDILLALHGARHTWRPDLPFRN